MGPPLVGAAVARRRLEKRLEVVHLPTLQLKARWEEVCDRCGWKSPASVLWGRYRVSCPLPLLSGMTEVRNPTSDTQEAVLEHRNTRTHEQHSVDDVMMM
jgi:hypothetical protein